MRRGLGSPPPAIGMIHDFVMLNALADTPVARGELAQANAALKTASEWCVSNRGSSDFRKPQMDRTTSIATFVAQSTRGDSACAVPQHTARQTSIQGLPDSAPLPTSSHRTGKSARFLGPLPRARTHVGRTKDATDRKPRAFIGPVGLMSSSCTEERAHSAIGNKAPVGLIGRSAAHGAPQSPGWARA